MQSSILIVLALALLSCLSSTNAAARGSTILIVGDSLSAAHNLASEQSWPILLQQRLQITTPKHRVINASISGESTDGGLQRLPALLKKYQPDIVVLELGGNDGLRGYKFSRVKKNLARMIELAQAQQARVLLIGVRMPPNLGALYNRRFQKIFESLAQQYDIAYLARFLQGIAADKPEYMQADGIHPTALAQPLLAERVYQAIAPWLE